MTSIVTTTPVWEKVTKDLFLNSIKPLGRPAILKGLVAHWPAVAAGWESTAALSRYIVSFYSGVAAPYFEGGPDIGGRFFYNAQLNGFNFERKRAPLTDVLDRLLALQDDASPPAIYAGSLSLAAYLPGFAADNTLGSLIPASQTIDSIWIGNRTVVAPHYDNTENIACVVAGKRRFTLFPTNQIGNLYIGPPDVTPAGQTISLVDTRTPDLAKFPRYADAMAAGEIAELEPGDALYLPTLWWHGVESLSDFGVLVNYWWRDVPGYFDSGANTLLHALLSLKDLPPAQRQRWKSVFDYLIFETDGLALEHLPPEVRGVFGELTAENAARLRAFLLKSLSR